MKTAGVIAVVVAFAASFVAAVPAANDAASPELVPRAFNHTLPADGSKPHPDKPGRKAHAWGSHNF